MTRFALRVALPVLIVVVIAVVAGFLIVRDMADQVDRAETTSIERAVRAAVNSNLTRLRETHGDYAVWDEAVQKLYGAVDQTFVDGSYRDSTRLGVLFDRVYLLENDGRTVFGYQRGQPAMRSAAEEFGPRLDVLVRSALADPKPFDGQAGLLLDSTGQITAVVVGTVEPSTEALERPLQPRLLVIARPIDAAAVRRMGSEFVIDDLRLVRNPPTAGASVELTDPGGQALGWMTWRPSSQGLEAFRRVAPTAYLTMGLICLTMLFLLGIGYSNFVALREREQEARRSANHDGLTGLPNRAALGRRLAEAVEMHDETGAPVALVYLDLDGFKEVNDANGHEAGDVLLRRVAHGFATICDGVGFLARVGGDEFAVILDRRDTVDRAEAIGEQLIRFFDEPVDVDGRLVTVGTSVGIAVLQNETIRARELLRRADVAMYLAKEFGRNRVALYDPSIDAARAERARLAEDLREALRLDQLVVVYQPIFDAASMRPSGVEALVRWLHPVHGLVPPDVFVPIAEESGLIEQVGGLVVRTACRDALAWGDIRLSVNVSPAQLRNPAFDIVLSRLIAEAGFPAERFEIEMTETHLVSHPERAQAIIARLRGIGVTIALDDFGTGYSSIAYLRRFTFDKLKLDRSLVVGITSDLSARRLCEATVALGRALDLQVTAEGVETEFEAAVLRKAGCDQLQGYAFARPMTADAVGDYLRAAALRPLAAPSTG